MRGLIGRAAVVGGAVVVLMGLVAGAASAGVNQAAPLASASTVPRGTLTPLPPNPGGKRVVDPTFPYKGGSTAHALGLAAAGQTLPMWQHSESYPAATRIPTPWWAAVRSWQERGPRRSLRRLSGF